MPISKLDLDKLPDSEVNCPRCDVSMKDAGECTFLRWESFPLLQGSGTESFLMRVCPRCGQIEMYV